MKFLSKSLIFSLLIGGLLSCTSDDTLDRDELALKAVYQEYNLDYNMENKVVSSKVYFRTSSYGSFVKLSDEDKISIKVEGSDNETYKSLVEKKEQIYFGSRNVPYYEGTTNLKTETNNTISWLWYDSETDQTITTTTKLFKPELISVSHDQDTVLDTMTGDELIISLKDELTENQTLTVHITNDLYGSTHYLGYDFNYQKDKEINTFSISSTQLRDDSNAATTKIIEKTKKKYGNLTVDVVTEKIVPVLTVGRQTYSISFHIKESKKTTNPYGKDGVINSSFIFPKRNIDINF